MQVSVVIPVYNEAERLREGILRLHSFLSSRVPFSWEVVIANNGSTDPSLEIAEELARSYPCIRDVRREVKGRGGALRQAWLGSSAEVLSYMDADLSSDLEAFPLLVGSILSGKSDLAVGSRLLKPEWTRRSLRREILSRGYNRIVRVGLGTRLSDAQCGFKAISRDAARRLLPRVLDDHWFFDTELIFRAERAGLRVMELPIRWVESGGSHVDVWRTSLALLRGIRRLRREPSNGQFSM